MRWRPVVGFVGLYEVSDTGRVRSVGTRVSPRELKLHTRKRDGYVVVGLHKGGRRAATAKVHRLVAEAFILNASGLPQVDHINGVRSDNRAQNLRWVCESQNGLNRATGQGVTGLVGAYRSSSLANPYRAAIRIDGVKKHIGVFRTAEEAANARKTYLERIARG